MGKPLQYHSRAVTTTTHELFKQAFGLRADSQIDINPSLCKDCHEDCLQPQYYPPPPPLRI